MVMSLAKAFRAGLSQTEWIKQLQSWGRGRREGREPEASFLACFIKLQANFSCINPLKVTNYIAFILELLFFGQDPAQWGPASNVL